VRLHLAVALSLRRTLEVDAHARTCAGGILRHAVYPVLLRSAAHHDEIARSGFENDRTTSRPRLDQESALRSQGEDRNSAFRSSTRKAITMPAGAVLSVAVKVQPQAVVCNTVVMRQGSRGLEKHRLRDIAHVVILRGQPWLAKDFIEHAPLMLSPRY